jgi:hypothetical protein
MPVTHDDIKLSNSKKMRKSSKIKPHPNEVLSSPRLSPQASKQQKRKNQAKSSKAEIIKRSIRITPDHR